MQSTIYCGQYMSTAPVPLGVRPPIVAIVGHIDHGKSTLLDYIRRTNVVDSEAGGITQHLSAYEAEHENATGKHRITFLDTPGHEAFKAMRARGLEVADVAILVVSGEDGVKPQTLEALRLIEEVKIPFIVALTKIDKPGVDINRAKASLTEHGIYVEGMGGTTPCVAVSGKIGTGVPELLDLILLAAEMEGLSANPAAPGEGLVIEANIDGKRGLSATLIVQNGTLMSGEYVVSGSSFAPVRIMENFLGKPIKEAKPGSPVRIVGFSSLPSVGAKWRAVESKREAEEAAAEERSRTPNTRAPRQATPSPTPSSGDAALEGEVEEKQVLILPIVIKTDVAGTGEAVMHEIDKLPKDERLEVRILMKGVGPISESDIKLVGSGKNPGIVLGFNVKVDSTARDLAERLNVPIPVFDIIYKLTEWLGAEIEKRRPRQEVQEKTGSAKVLKIFSTVKGRVVLGGRVDEGELTQGGEVKIMRRDLELGLGEIVSLQSQKTATKKVEAGSEFGAMIKTSVDPAPGDRLESFKIVLN